MLHRADDTSSNHNETAVHGCNPAKSALVVLLSHKVYFLCSTISLAVLFVMYSSTFSFAVLCFQLSLSNLNACPSFVTLLNGEFFIKTLLKRLV